MPAFFTKKNLAPIKRVCSFLKEIREKKGVDLEKLSNLTKISKKHLEALEECRFNDLPKGVVYQKSFIRRYTEALSTNPEPFLRQYLVEEAGFKSDFKHPHCVIKQGWFNNLPLFFRYGAMFLLMAVLVFYLGWQVKHILEPPILSVYSPPEGFIVTNSYLLVQGETEREARVYINGKEVMNNEEGRFKEAIDLTQGVNTISVSAEKKYGKITTEVRHVIFKGS